MGWASVKHDPVKKAAHLKHLKERRLRLLSDPSYKELQKAKNRFYSNRWRHNIKENHPDKYRDLLKRERDAAARKRNKPEYYKKQTSWYKAHRNKHPDVALAHTVRTHMNAILNGRLKSGRTLDLLGCSLGDFRSYIEKQFQPGMSWDNRGLKGWHLDHKRPCASFDLTDPEQQRICFHYSNIQPLWALENKRKSSTFNGVLQRHKHEHL